MKIIIILLVVLLGCSSHYDIVVSYNGKIEEYRNLKVLDKDSNIDDGHKWIYTNDKDIFIEVSEVYDNK